MKKHAITNKTAHVAILEHVKHQELFRESWKDIDSIPIIFHLVQKINEDDTIFEEIVERSLKKSTYTLYTFFREFTFFLNG